ncbi:MAG: hypothetical protein Ct9H300mP1_17600 [Planctomycetaceae bacterium]|nr:MAG: hypothetical protein Ct9H300mP1_17600 [Planctomycetaceae bacterium]
MQPGREPVLDDLAVLGTSPGPWASPKASRLSSRGKNEKTKDVQTVIADHNT